MNKLLKNEEYIKDTVFCMIADIKDPEFDKTLEELNVVQFELISIKSINNKYYEIVVFKNKDIRFITIEFQPTNPKCAFASQIGLAILYKVKLEMPNIKYFKFAAEIKKGYHDEEAER